MKQVFPLIVIITLILLVYSDLTNAFYQQDEWYFFGSAFSKGLGKHLTTGSPLSLFIHRPVGRVFNVFCFRLFGLNYFYYGLTSILLHCLNSILVYFLAARISKNTLFSFLAALFFAFNSPSTQSFIWFSALNTAALSLTFLLLTLIFFSYFIESKRRKYFYLSFIAFLLSVLTKESNLPLFVLLPFFPLIFKDRRKILTVENLSFLGAGVFYFVLRLLDFAVSSYPSTGRITAQGSVGLRLLLNSIFYPLEGLSQIFTPVFLLFSWSGKLTSLCPWLKGSNLIGLARETIFGEFVSLSLSLFLLIFVFLLGWYLEKKKKREGKILWFSLSFLLLSFLPYIFLTKGHAFLEGRHYYPAILGAAFLFALLLSEGWEILFRKRNLGYYVSVLACAAVFSSCHIGYIQKDIKALSETSAVRKMILGRIRKEKPTLDQKTIFYVSGNVAYVLPELKIPFQQGFGWTLLVWYYETGTVKPEFFADDFLWDMGTEGYKEIGNRGFGYFGDYKKLLETIKKYQLKPENVYGFFYDAPNIELLDITSKLREKLDDDLQKPEGSQEV